MAEAPRPPLPPFTEETARAKVAAAQAAWNSKDIDRIAAAYSENSEWRNRAEFVKGRDQIKEVGRHLENLFLNNSQFTVLTVV